MKYQGFHSKNSAPCAQIYYFYLYGVNSKLFFVCSLKNLILLPESLMIGYFRVFMVIFRYSSLEPIQSEPIWSMSLLTIMYLYKLYCMPFEVFTRTSYICREQVHLFTSQFGITKQKFGVTKSVNSVASNTNFLKPFNVA